MLQPLYTQVACEYADLHDRAGRMKAVGAIRESALGYTNPGCFFGYIYVGDLYYPVNMGKPFFYMDPYQTTSIVESNSFFFSWLTCWFL